ncbi:MAG: gliding motility-associated ABC transporter substrate-binding protein GldG, partial [Candidatus Nephrothrix sp. EaCA]
MNQSIENVEFELAQAIYSLTNLRPKKIGIVTGHGELDSLAMDGFLKILKELFSVSHAQLTNPAALKPFRVLIIAKPTQPFSDAEKYNLDQFILKGGRVLFLIDRLEADMKQVSHEGYLAMAYNTQLEDQLFRYGVRVNAGLIQDQVCGKYPTVAGQTGNQPQIMLMDWVYFPLIMRYGDHVITRNMDACATQFISSLDTVKAIGIRKTPLLFSSPTSRFINSPVKIDIAQVRREMSEVFHQG